jgi:drug/metabolite transporter (DMT)-like permease
VFLAIVSTIIATWMNNYALSKIQVSTSSAFSGVSTLITILLGVLVGGEKLYSFHIVGLFLIALRMVGVSYIDIKRTKRIK